MYSYSVLLGYFWWMFCFPLTQYFPTKALCTTVLNSGWSIQAASERNGGGPDWLFSANRWISRGVWSELICGRWVIVAVENFSFHSRLHNPLSSRAPLKVLSELPLVHVNFGPAKPMSMSPCGKIQLLNVALLCMVQSPGELTSSWEITEL